MKFNHTSKSVAIYGKGGIGKSTLTSNISAALSLMGKKVLQIGCDPKHDSTRMLMGGIKINTVLDYIKETGPLDYKLEDVLFTGYNGIGCIEAGGPKPGVGCAGRGIITSFDFLDKFSIKENYDLIFYDVLGDVVCGGFAVPIREEYADEIFIVTSGEYMSLYAANNILRGVKNYETRNRLAGILYNSRNLIEEDEKVKKFAKAVKLPILAKIPRDPAFERAEKKNMCLFEAGEEKIASIFSNLARDILVGHTLHPAYPLTDEELEECIMGTYYSKSLTPKEYRAEKDDNEAMKACDENMNREACSYKCGYLSKNLIREEPLHGCAFNGAVAMGIHLKDTIIIAHSPKHCAYLSYQSISSSGRRNFYERGEALGIYFRPNLMSTDLDEGDIVFGGMEKLEIKIKELMDRKVPPKAIIIVSSCPAGIIGDDIDKVREMSTDETKIITIKADGNLAGDYLQGMLMCYTGLASQIIDEEVESEDKVVNIVFEKVVSKNTEANFRLIEGYLHKMGVSVNCRFLSNTSYDSLKNFKRASLNLIAYKDYTGKILEEFFSNNYGCDFFPYQFPVGFYETERWLRGIGEYFGQPKEANKIIEENRKLYRDELYLLKPKIEGKRLMIVTYNHDVDWILRAALDCGMEIAKIGILNFSQDEQFRSDIDEIEHINVIEDYDRDNIGEDLERLKPDILLTNYGYSDIKGDYISDTMPMCPDVGFFAGLNMVRRWSNLICGELEGEWQDDRELFEKYYA